MWRLFPLLLLLGCPDEGTPEEPDAPPATEVACELGLREGDRGFAPMGAAPELEMLQGFQGFLVILPRIRLEGPVALMNAHFGVALDGEAPFGGAQLDTELFGDGASHAVTDDIVVFLTPTDVSHFKDREAELTIRLENRTHTCTVSRRVLLVDHDVCVHAADEPVCPDGGVGPDLGEDQ